MMNATCPRKTLCDILVHSLPGCCMELVGSLLPMLRDNVLVPSSRDNNAKKNVIQGGCVNV